MIGWFIGWLFYRSNYIINYNTFIASVTLIFSESFPQFPYNSDSNIIRVTLLSEAGDSLSFSA